MIRFGSRGSDLALTQTRMVATALREATGVDFEIEVIQTRGDRNQTQALPSIGGKGLFTLELEEALRAGSIDVAVHSLKDLPVADPDGICTAAIPRREDPADVLLYRPECEDPEGGSVPLLGESRVGTSSPRRASSLLSLRPDLRCLDIRGNIDTRSRKVAEGQYEATLLAAAGLARLGLETPGLRRKPLAIDACTPAPGQGALGIQCRSDDAPMRELLAHLHDETTARCVGAERQLLFLLGGGCSMPLGALCEQETETQFRLRVSLFSTTRPRLGLRRDLRGPDPAELATRAADNLRPLLDEPLAGRRVVMLRPAHSNTDLDKALGFAGAEIEVLPVSEQVPIEAEAEGLKPDHLAHIAFTSARAVDMFFEYASAHDLQLSDSQFYAVGPSTAAAVRARGHSCHQPAEPRGGAAMAEFMGTQLRSGAPCLFPCAEQRQPDFEASMRDQGFRVFALPLYRTVPLPGLSLPETEVLIYTSPSAVQATRQLQTSGTPQRLALGQSTAAAMEEAGIPCDAVAPQPTPQALLRLLQTPSDGHPTPPPAP